MIYDKSKIITPAMMKRQSQNASTDFLGSVMQGLGQNVKEKYAEVEDTVLEQSSVMEFEFDDFSVVVEDGKFGVQFEDPEDGLVVQFLAGEGENEPEFPYLFEVDGVEKSLTEEDYHRIKDFMRGAK